MQETDPDAWNFKQELQFNTRHPRIDCRREIFQDALQIQAEWQEHL